MRKLLLALLALPCLAMASSLDVDNLSCKGMPLTQATTLHEVKNKCHLIRERYKDGLFEVKFFNSATRKKVTCYFADDKPRTLLNSCK